MEVTFLNNGNQAEIVASCACLRQYWNKSNDI
ncbi:hypothetical protein COLO4_36915 [Corchorus olitorius]|uniref:Uncharacterized protein n=1 Tax=Corchorus olitorius TaxID=93759 RepID=A0A1R3G4A6_9ROSI|nr:hypothetical protein COLO4_36915 [Corchorus olitorius]